MATELPIEPRRVMLRRGRGGGFAGGFGATPRLDGAPQGYDADEADDIIDPNMGARARANLPAPISPEEGRDNPRARLNEVAMMGSASYTREYRLDLLHRLLMRGTPLDQIARTLQVSISTMEKDRAELKRRLRQAAKELNIEELVGNQTAVYDEIQAVSMRMASSRDIPAPMKLASLRTALAANADKSRFYTAAGVFDVLRFRRAEDGNDLSDVQLLMQQTAELLAGLDAPEPAPAPIPRPAIIRRKRPGGFEAHTFDDADASSSANEVQEL